MHSKSTRLVIDIDGLLLIAFIVLKLCGVINWSWWWVLSPLWILPALIGVVFLFYIVGMLIIISFKKKRNRVQKQELSKWQQRLRDMQERQNKTGKI